MQSSEPDAADSSEAHRQAAVIHKTVIGDDGDVSCGRPVALRCSRTLLPAMDLHLPLESFRRCRRGVTPRSSVGRQSDSVARMADSLLCLGGRSSV